MPKTLVVYIDDQRIPITVPEFALEDNAVYRKMDADMDRGWQISRDWVDHPNLEQRLQVAADRILGAVEAENEQVAVMMAGYILTRAPQVKAVRISTSGEIQETELLAEEDPLFF